MKKILSSIIATAAALSGVALTAPAANAEVAASVSISASPTIVVPENACVTHPINYDVVGVQPGKRWSLDVYVYKADGTLRGSGTALQSLGAPTTGTIDVQFCGLSYEPQTVTVTSELDYYDANDLAVTGVAGNTLSLNIVREVKTKVALKVKRKGTKATATGTVTATAGSTVTPVTSGKVTLQKRVGKKWKKVAFSVTDGTGAYKIKAKGIKRGTSVRTVFAGLGEFTAVGVGVAIPAKASKVVRVR